MSTSELVKDLVAHKLSRAGYRYNDHTPPTPNPTPAQQTMRILGDQFSTVYNDKFQEMTTNIPLTDDTINEDFRRICESVFQEDVNWGRIVGIIVFCASISLKAMEHDRPDMVHNLVNWTIELLESNRIFSWMAKHGGWTGFVEYYKRPETRNGHNNHQNDMSWGKVCTAGIATIAAGAAVMNFFKYKG